MTREEAIEWFRNSAFYRKDHEPFNMAIKALSAELCDDCISREAIGLTDFEILMCGGDYKKALEMLIDRIQKAPSVTSKSKIGHWVGVNPMVDTLMCSECGENIISEEFKSNYCPNCGAKMLSTDSRRSDKMQIVIDIPEEYYKIVKHRVEHGDYFKPYNLIANGTPLPKHGRLIDESKITKCEQIGLVIKDDDVTRCLITDAPTILEADAESEYKEEANE